MAGKIKSLEKKLSEFKSNHYKEKYEPKIEKCAGVKVISVSGSGGSGITTLAVSIAKELGKLDHKVCVIDMDIPSSDCDGFFNVNGIIRDSLSSLDLLAKGSWCTDDIVNIPCGSLVSGFRSKKKLDWKKSDWDKMFKELSESGDYEYFVVDLGNLGVSEDIDNLIKAVYGISDSFLVSCDNDDYRCTNLIRKMLALKMSGFVVLNRCVNSKACNIVSMHDIDNMMIPFEIDIFGVRDSLALGSLSKRKLQGLIERVM
jgi:MinD-like ATPase involved in chromosome partitioning or flagellar assembly